MLSKDNVQDVYALTPMQAGMLLEHVRDPESAAYIEQLDFVMEGELDIDAVRRSFAALVAKYDVLRTIISFRRTDQPRQVVLRARAAEVERIGIEPGVDAEQEVERYKQAERARSFDLSADLLVRLAVLSLGPRHHRMVMTFHHIILDGWCFGPLFEDFFGFYERIRKTPDAVIDEREAAPYRDYVRWLEQQDQDEARAYWADCLAGYEQAAGPPYFDRAYAGPAGAAEHDLDLGPALSARLTTLAREQRLTLASLVQTAWGIVLQKYNQTDDVVFGTVVSGRPPELPGVERMVGLFINTQPLRVTCAGGDLFVEAARAVNERLFAGTRYEYYPLAATQALSPLRAGLVNHVLTFENFPVSEQMRRLSAASEALRVTDVRVYQAAKFDFHVMVFPGDDLRVRFVYNPHRYEATSIETLARSLGCLLQAVAEQPERPVGQLPVCAPADARRVLVDFNATASDYPAERSVVELFEETCARHGGATAVREGEASLGYAALRTSALALAARLREAGVGSGDHVALLAPRSTEMVVASLAVLYCGAAYVPLELHAADERLRFMLKDCGAKVLCVHPQAAARAPAGVTTIVLDTTAADAVDGPPGIEVSAEQPAYVMYTSGSTGQPKACLVSHRNIVRLVCNTNYLDLGPHTCFLQTGSPAFDASTLEVWGPLLNGGSLVIVEETTLLDAAALRAALERYAVTTLWLTTALFNQLCGRDPAMFATLRELLVGGDVLSPRHIEMVRTANPDLTLINGYGPTENTTFSTTHTIRAAAHERVPIGRPIANSTAYVLDGTGALLPPGAYGELCVGGDGVALGYLEREALTREKFIADPFRPDGRCYRTGDIARWLPDGSLDLLGRNDFQVKIRGFRVELGEIERALLTHPAITDAVVVAHAGPLGKQLHAFYVGTQALPVAALRAHLSALPTYMVPQHYLRLAEMPLTANGKLDRRALPIERSLAAQPSAAPAQARSDTERRIAEICRDIIGLEQIGVHENFFEAGADSLGLIAINNRLREAFARDIPVAVLFEHTSIARLAQYLDTDAEAGREREARETQQLDQARQALLRTRNRMKQQEPA